MSAPAGVTLIQRFPYRGAQEEYSNQYHFGGSPPSDDAGWLDLINELAGDVAPALSTDNYITRAYGYADTDAHSVFTKDFGVDGDEVRGSCGVSMDAYRAPGDAAAWVRWKTDHNNTNGKPVYLRKYYHGVWLLSSGGDYDLVDPMMTAALVTMADVIAVAGTDWPGLCDPEGHAPPGPTKASLFVTTRTLKRRGARPH